MASLIKRKKSYSLVYYYTDENGVEHTLGMTRLSGHQYEAYVDMVMSFCELLDIDYSNWDPAVKRAKEIGWKMD